MLGTEVSRGIWCAGRDPPECLFCSGLSPGAGGTAEVPTLPADIGHGGDCRCESESDCMS